LLETSPGGKLARTVQGITHTWQVSDTPIGSGDAGEVYAVACLDQPSLSGMMKKPARIATAGTIQRQASQIAQEAVALARLDGLPDGKAHPPRLLDQAPPYTMGTGNFFIISETAPGEDLTSLLSKSRKMGKPFPRRVIVTVLDALFDMFSRAHKAGVLWNDVKLDHIYWYNRTGEVAVIDWGNALFIDNADQPALPHWEDYQQMVDTLGTFLQHSAPDLFIDLGWDEFMNKTLDSPRVSVLARRISYQQQVIALQVMEYQSLIRVVLNSDPTLDGLRKMADYKTVLEKIGVPWESEAVLKYSHDLVQRAVAEDDRQTCVRATALVWDIFDDALDLPWHLMREYCRHTDILTHSAFPVLVKQTLNANWGDALWAASTIASQSQNLTWWEGLIPVMRQKALDTSTPLPYRTSQSILRWAQEHQHRNLAHRLEHILQNWRKKGETGTESPFEYELLDILRERADLPGRLRSDAKQVFALGDAAILALMKAWNHANWDALPGALCQVLSWDPDRWGIHRVLERVENFREWLSILQEGPGLEVSAHQFLENLLKKRPEIERLLGSPPWLGTLLHMLYAIEGGAPIPAYQAEVSRHCPWLLGYPDISSVDRSAPPLDEATRHTLLSDFNAQLRDWQAVDASLKTIQEQAPLLAPTCKWLTDAFKWVLSLNANLAELRAISRENLPPELAEGYQVLHALVEWRERLALQDLPGAIQALSEEKPTPWTLSVQAHQVTVAWQNLILPAIDAIRISGTSIDFKEGALDPHTMKVRDIALASMELPRLWEQIYTAGIYTQLLETLQTEIDAARSAFLEWRTELENATDPITRLLYHSHLDQIRQASNRLMRMSQHIRQAKLSFLTLSQGVQISQPMEIRSIENILDHLEALEAELVPNPDEKQFPEYQLAFREISEAKNAETRQALVNVLPQNHPFYAWLVKSTLTQDTFYL